MSQQPGAHSAPSTQVSQRPLRRAPRQPYDPLAALVGHSPVFAALKTAVIQCARWDVPVLIEGETGTGKEIVARAMHYVGPRVSHAFVPVNCGALPDTLVENELFGHQRGAYTGAHAQHLGLVAQAEGGTLFLDEIEALSPRAQATLLRFMQDATYRPLGSNRENRSDVRIITASNISLDALVAAGQFRPDLLYRLRVLEVRVPSLAERGEDLMLLAAHFVARYARVYGLPVKALHPDMLAWMQRHVWPGNVRELENLIHRAYLMSAGDLLDLPPPAGVAGPDASSAASSRSAESMTQAKARAVAEFERTYLAGLMAQCDGNVSQAARIAGKERRSLGRLLKKHGLTR